MISIVKMYKTKLLIQKSAQKIKYSFTGIQKRIGIQRCSEIELEKIYLNFTSILKAYLFLTIDDTLILYQKFKIN